MSPYSIPTLVVPMNGNTFCLCVDSRAINNHYYQI